MHTTAKILTKSNKPIRIKESLSYLMTMDKGETKPWFLNTHFCLTKHSKILAMYYFAGFCGWFGSVGSFSAPRGIWHLVLQALGSSTWLEHRITHSHRWLLLASAAGSAVAIDCSTFALIQIFMCISATLNQTELNLNLNEQFLA